MIVVNQPSITDWIASLGGLAGFTALAIELFRARRRLRCPPEGLELELLWLQDATGDVIAHGGQESFWFLDPERRRHEAMLALLDGQVVDKALSRSVVKARANFIEAGALAPGHGQLGQLAFQGQVQRQVEAASAARTAATEAITRCNALLRKYPR